LRRLETDRDNFGTAIDWALRHDPEMAVRLTSALAYFWLIGRHRPEVRWRLNQAVDAGGDVSPARRARALAFAAVVGATAGNLETAASQAEEACRLSKELGDPWWTALSQGVLGLAIGLQRDARGSQLLEEARASFEQMGEEWGAALTCLFLGYVSGFAAAQHERAAALARRGLNGFRAAGDQWGQTMTLELLGWLARRRGAYQDAVAVYEEALGVIRDLGLPDEVPMLLVDLGNVQVLLEDYEAAAILHGEALVLGLELGARDTVAYARNGLGLVARRQGRYEQAKELHSSALSFFREGGFPEETVYSLACLGFVEELRGDLEAAEAFHRECLMLTRESVDELPVAVALEGLACVAAAREQPGRAAMLLGAAASIRAHAGTPLSPQERLDANRATDAAVGGLGHEAFTGSLNRGGRMSIEEAAAYALSGSSVG
jgi:tetratricopeptide (TPR) repeat protein